MGRPPCCEKVGIKKGPWTPEEDIILVSYIQEHGPGNWRSVPINTGLMRCSKSCRLRWTNYLRPGIKRGNFTPHEEGIIIHLQSLLGNRWAAIASYLPQRTDNDIKNYWNTHLKKKLKKYQAMGSLMASSELSTAGHELMISKGYTNGATKPSLSNMTHSPILNSSECSSSYASSTENISKLLQGFMRSPSNADTKPIIEGKIHQGMSSFQVKCDQDIVGQLANEEIDPLLSFNHFSGTAWENNSSESAFAVPQPAMVDTDHEAKQPPFSVLEKWLLDEATGQVDLKELSANCCSDTVL